MVDTVVLFLRNDTVAIRTIVRAMPMIMELRRSLLKDLTAALRT